LGLGVAVVPGGETTGLFAHQKQHRRNKQTKRQHRQPPQQRQSPQQTRNSAINKVNHCMFILFVFFLVVWVFVICVPGKKKKKKKQRSSEKSSTHKFVSLVAMLCLCVSPIHNSTRASKALTMEQMAQAHSAQVELAAAAVAPSPPSSDTFGHYGIDKILCVGPDVVQWACVYVKKRGYEHIGDGTVL